MNWRIENKAISYDRTEQRQSELPREYQDGSDSSRIVMRSQDEIAASPHRCIILSSEKYRIRRRRQKTRNPMRLSRQEALEF